MSTPQTIDSVITACFETPARRNALCKALTLTAAAHSEAASQTTHPEVARIASGMAAKADEAARWAEPPDFEALGLSQRLIVFQAARVILGFTHAEALAMAAADDAARGNTHFLQQD